MNDIIINSIIIVILTLVIIIPVIIINRINSKKRLQKLSGHFDMLAGQNKADISLSDSFSLKKIGLDPVKGILIFIDHQGQNQQELVIDVRKAGNCSLIKTMNNGAVSELKLVFDNKNSNNIIFYRQYRDKESDLKLLTEKAEFWNQKLVESAKGYS